jgi:hypothetical protein
MIRFNNDNPLICPPYMLFRAAKLGTYARTIYIILPSRCLSVKNKIKVIIQEKRDHLYPRQSNDRWLSSLMLLDLDLDEDAVEVEREAEC